MLDNSFPLRDCTYQMGIAIVLPVSPSSNVTTAQIYCEERDERESKGVDLPADLHSYRSLVAASKLQI